MITNGTVAVDYIRLVLPSSITFSWLEEYFGSEFFDVRGRLGYTHGRTNGNVTFMKSGREDMGVCVEASGGREGLVYRRVLDLLKWVQDVKVTRLDVKADIPDDGSLFDDALQSRDFRIRGHEWAHYDTSKGRTVSIGSRSSACMIRVYDKWAESGYRPQFEGIIRVEFEMKSDMAQAMAAWLVKSPTTEDQVFRYALEYMFHPGANLVKRLACMIVDKAVKVIRHISKRAETYYKWLQAASRHVAFWAEHGPELLGNLPGLKVSGGQIELFASCKVKQHVLPLG